MQEKPEGLITSPKLFQISTLVRLRDDAIGLKTFSARAVRLRPSGFGLRRDNFRQHYSTKVGGEYRARTGDLLVANQALSQLS